MNFTPKQGIRVSHRKESHFLSEFAVIDLDTGRAPITLRIYGTSTHGSNSACLWISDRTGDRYATGSGRAGGYGYHRPSAAAQEAFTTAGVDLDSRIDGVGDSAIREALDALARHLGLNRFVIHEAHP